jgi:hypothetical protein
VVHGGAPEELVDVKNYKAILIPLVWMSAQVWETKVMFGVVGSASNEQSSEVGGKGEIRFRPY